MTIYYWALFAFCTSVLAEMWGAVFARYVAAVCWLVMLIALIFGARL